MATKINDAGIHFPIMAICLGMEEMTTWTFKPRQIVASSCPGAENISLPLHFTKNASSSRLLGNLPSNIAQYLTTENVTANNHKNCVYMKTYFFLPQLNQFYNVLTTNLDGNGVEYASTIEAKSYPFFGLQWHPEKPNFFHHLNMAYNRSLHAILIGQHFSNVLVEQAKMNRQSFKSVHEEKLFLFNNYCTTFSDTFSEYYYFTDADVPKFE
ncbi:GGH1 [Bugula neritina]|uniref:folate gamma-glutamyl hydrolase n=2 Tax=Bugula neritina TaxID=10212 RepID=A0A7J7K991_BUGNE|nr:GGH1 [Bugula neritina]